MKTCLETCPTTEFVTRLMCRNFFQPISGKCYISIPLENQGISDCFQGVLKSTLVYCFLILCTFDKTVIRTFT